MTRTLTAGLLLLLLITMVAPCPAAQDAPAKVDKPEGQWETFKDPAGLFSVCYPREWVSESSQDEPGYVMLNYSRMDNTNSVLVDGEVYVEKLDKPMSLDDLSASYDRETKELYPTYQPSASSKEAIGALQFARKTYTRQEADKTVRQGVVWLASSGDWIITMAFDTSQDHFEKMRPTMEKIARSFVLGKS